MRVVSWNMRRANGTSPAWNILVGLQPDIALLQEVSGIPDDVRQSFDITFQNAINKQGRLQRFGTAVLVRGTICARVPLSSEYAWVNQELTRFGGNLVCCTVQINEYSILNVMSVYSPAWPVQTSDYPPADVRAVQLTRNPKVWCTEILWSVLSNTDLAEAPWIIGGDLNISETFDAEWQDGHGVRFGLRSAGNREILDRMAALGFTECLRQFRDTPTPTFRNPRNGQLVHQMDHLFVTTPLRQMLSNCTVGNESEIFMNSVSDHLPIIADFRSL